MKKVSKFSMARVPSFFLYLVAVSIVVSAFFVGKHCFFTGVAWFIVGLAFDPKFNRDNDGKKNE